MSTFLIAASIGAYLSLRCSVDLIEGCAGVTVNYEKIWQDLIALLTFVAAVCDWGIEAGRNARTYFDLALLPWLSDRGISVKLPTMPQIEPQSELN
ncbi:hypothetical protein H6F89_30360 [Cyanobacteria bacterium FACHB-63]|nr:hypothetical protein [Cyanobacteria bacterium FACHB-63]